MADLDINTFLQVLLSVLGTAPGVVCGVFPSLFRFRQPEAFGVLIVDRLGRAQVDVRIIGPGGVMIMPDGNGFVKPPPGWLGKKVIISGSDGNLIQQCELRNAKEIELIVVDRQKNNSGQTESIDGDK